MFDETLFPFTTDVSLSNDASLYLSNFEEVSEPPSAQSISSDAPPRTHNATSTSPSPCRLCTDCDKFVPRFTSTPDNDVPLAN